MAREGVREHEQRHQQSPAGALWRGTISFGLVAVPVELISVQHPARSGLRMLTGDGEPVGRRYYCPRHGRALSSDEVVRGYPVDGGFVQVTDEELDQAAPDRSREIDLRRFVARSELDPALFDRAYLLAPGGDTVKAYRLLAAAMERRDVCGIATFVMRGHEYLVAIYAERGLLRGETLRFADELRDAERLPVPPSDARDDALFGKLGELVRERTVDQLPAELLRDEHTEQLERLVARKRAAGRDVVTIAEVEPEQPRGEIVDLMDLLERRLAER